MLEYFKIFNLSCRAKFNILADYLNTNDIYSSNI